MTGTPRKPSDIQTSPQTVSEEQEDELADLAMMLREEQVQARIVHYKGDMETNAELDAITAEVVAQLKGLQSRVAADRSPESRASAELEQTRSLVLLLGRVFRDDQISVLLEKVLKDVTKRVTKLFFDSELSEKVTASEGKTRVMHHAEQALFYVYRRYQNRLLAELEGFTYVDPEIKTAALDRFDKDVNELRVAFLSRRSPELKRLLAVINGVALEFFQRGFPPKIDEFARAVVSESGCAKTKNAVGYKVLHESFGPFRQVFERKLMGHLVGYVQQRVIAQLQTSEQAFRNETIAFVQSPRLYSDIVSVASDALYEFLCNEGFLDLPIDWRAELRAE